MTQPQAQQRLDRAKHLWFLLGEIKNKNVVEEALALFCEQKLEDAIALANKTIELQGCLTKSK